MKTSQFSLRGSLLLPLLLLATIPSNAQLDSIAVIPFSDVWALEFGIGSDLVLTSFLDADISGAKYLRDGRKIRLSLRIRGNGTTQDDLETEHRADTLYQISDRDREDSYQSISLLLQYFGYTRQLQDVSLFVGGGPVASYSITRYSNDTRRRYPDTYQERYLSDGKLSNWEVGASVAAGVEWFFAKQMSLHAEYGMRFTYVRSNRTDNYHYLPTPYHAHYVNHTESNSTGWRVASEMARFGMTICY